MNINPINNIVNLNITASTAAESAYAAADGLNQSEKLMKELDKMSMINNPHVSNSKNYELNLSMEELEKRTHKDYLTTKKMLAVDSQEYN